MITFFSLYISCVKNNLTFNYSVSFTGTEHGMAVVNSNEFCVAAYYGILMICQKKLSMPRMIF